MDEIKAASPAPAPVENANTPVGTDHEEEMPRVAMTRRNILVFALFVLSTIAFLYLVLPRFAGLGKTWDRITDGDPWWIAVAVVLEIVSFLGYVMLFRTVFVRDTARIGWRESYQITMAGLAATRLLATGGAGGIALTAWALRRAGLRRLTVASRMVGFMVLLYGVFAGSLVLGGIGLRTGILPGESPWGLTVVPAAIAASLIALALLMALLPGDLERRLSGVRSGSDRFRRWAHRGATVPAAVAQGIRTALRITRQGDAGALGAIVWWYADIAVLWASFHAFGEAPPVAVCVMAYFVGMVANLLPLPGGIGGVDGGMIGAFIAFDVEPGLAIVAVLVYRGIAFWLPTIPGAIAYLQLRKTVSRWKAEPARATARA